MKKTFKIKWNGSSTLANILFGSRYGTDWKHASNKAGDQAFQDKDFDIIVGKRVIKTGEEIEYTVEINEPKLQK